MADLGPAEPVVVRSHYAHMLAEDVRVWSRFLESGIVALDGVWYDVRVGEELALGPDSPEFLRRVSRGVTRKRIDVVAQSRGEVWVIEVKPFGSYVALGQVLTYRRLFMEEYEPSLPVRGVVVCENLDDDVGPVFLNEGIDVFEVRP